MVQENTILRVDLSSGDVRQDPIPLSLRQKYLGGQGINDWLLWEHFLKVDPRIDPLSADNVLIAGLGPLGATGWGGGSKMKWTYKSPAYNMFGDSVSGGAFGSVLRWAGYDHLVITGKALQPVYLWINDGLVEIRDASHLWGKDSEATNHALKKELGEGVETACIGQAAENGVTFGQIVVSGHRVAGRTGAGAVMGSKNLKAIAVRGTRGIDVYDPAGFFKAIDDLLKITNEKVPARYRDSWKKLGTMRGIFHQNNLWCNPYRNNQQTRIPQEKVEKLHHHLYREKMQRTCFSCSPGCSWGCDGGYRLSGDMVRKGVSVEGTKPEYVSMSSLGAAADIDDLPTVAHLATLCREYGMDVVEVGVCIGFLFELWQRGIINEKDTMQWTGEPLRLEWGNHAAAEKVLTSIGLQNNELGKLLKHGVYQAALKIEQIKGVPVRQFAMYGKGGSPFIMEVRHYPSWALNMATSSRGACHLKAAGTIDKTNREDISRYYFGTPEGAKPFDLKLKGASSAVCDNRCTLINCLGLCIFFLFNDPTAYPLEVFGNALRALMGLDMNPDELSLAAERTVNLEKAFNSRLGFRREDDTLCHRWMDEKLEEGPGKGWKARDYLEQLKDEYYEWHGWDKATSLQTRRKLEQLDMGDVADVLKSEGALVEEATETSAR